MLESKKVKVTIMKSIAGNADPRHDLPRPFSYQPGDHIEVHPKLAKAWIESGVAVPFGTLTLEELVNLKLPAA